MSMNSLENFSFFLDQLTTATSFNLSTRKAEKLHQTLENALQSLDKSSTLETKVWLELCVSCLRRILMNHPERCTQQLALVLAPNTPDELISSFCSLFKSSWIGQEPGSIYGSFVQLLESYERQHLGTGTKHLEVKSDPYFSAIAAERLFWFPTSIVESVVLEAAESSHPTRHFASERIPWDAISIFAEEGEEEMLCELLYQLKNDNYCDDLVSLNVMEKLLLGFCATEFSETFSRALHRMYHENKTFWLNLDEVIHLPSVVQRVAYQSLSSDNFQFIKRRLLQLQATLLNESSVTFETAMEWLNSDILTPLCGSFLEAMKDCKILEAVPMDTLYIIMYYSHELIMKTENTTLLFRLSITYSCILLFMENFYSLDGIWYNLLIADICKSLTLRRFSMEAFFTVLVPFGLSKLCCANKLLEHSLFHTCFELFSKDA
ncbi:hypothetical protein GpartN1_g1626.t1 [Galdieria partita]|uniref:Uncharacterized protein n=1 Tax=Galdieria partita TaxID=83374 RepID=A0A9C7UNT7_9RHOD|nr:hypothetical protein GpartN1_g1626.t1 [Galdieria partita]